MVIRKTQNLKNKKILITAGPTWVPVDSVRVISNIATGETGILLAKEANKSGARVTLLLGPVGAVSLAKKINLIRFKYFNELRKLVREKLKSEKFDFIIHSAAVSDFRPKRLNSGKIDSSKRHSLKLVPLPKIIDDMRRLAPLAKLVMFKLETDISDEALIKRAERSRQEAGADFAVANKLNPYRAFVIAGKDKTLSVKSKIEIAKKIFKIINA